MSYIAYRTKPNGTPRIGQVTSQNTIKPLSYATGKAVTSLHDLIERWEETKGGEALTADETGEVKLDDGSVEVLAPLRGRDVMCVGYNYKKHHEEFAATGIDKSIEKEYPTHPVIFSKRATSIVGTKHPIYPHTQVTQQLDYEGEMGIIIGKGGYRIPKEQGWDHVWGATIINDVTARDRQGMHKQFFIAKGMDTHCPMGPYAVHKSQLDFKKMILTTKVNGKMVQNQSTSDLIFDVPTLIEILSMGMTLQPGDVIATGTPVGVAAATGNWLKPGDKVEIEITGLGKLENTVAEEEDVPTVRSMSEERKA